MPNSPEAMAYRKAAVVWVEDPNHPDGGYDYARLVHEDNHGTWNAYNNWYCRCPPCTEANRVRKDPVDDTDAP